MGLLGNIVKFFNTKIKSRSFKKELLILRKKLRLFQSIFVEKEIHDSAYLIKDNLKLIELYKDYQSLMVQIENHNKKITELTENFIDITRDNGIDFILKNIDDYPLEKLKDFNNVALEINDYSITNEFPYKNEFLQYMVELGKLINEYDTIKEQFTLLKAFDDVIKSLEDKYIDEKESKPIIDLLNEIILKLKSHIDKFYDIPVLNEKLIDIHNENFINNHTREEIFNDINGKSLDIEQRKAILCDSKSNLTIAGAGAGKTLTICGKVKWLLEHNKINPNDILLLSYSKASADDLDAKVSKIQDGLKVKTFHSLGLEILNKVNGAKRTIEEQFKAYINKFFEEELKTNIIASTAVFNFYTLYLYANSNEDKQYEDDGKKFEDLKKEDYKTLKDRLSSVNENKEKHETIQKEFVKSKEELILANWLFINGVKYEYERSYEIQTCTPEKRQYTPDFYLTDYGIYLEHYGINKYGKTPQYTKEQEQEYLRGIEWKRQTHAQNNTKCIETFSYEFSDGTVFNKLKQVFEENGIVLNPLTQEEITNSLNTIYMGQEFNSLFNLIMTFLSLYKAQYPDKKGFEELRMYDFEFEYERKRTHEFLNICECVYDYYINEIRKQDKIDFDDMILQSINALNNTNDFKYKYIIVDEFQDISQSRKKFLQKLISHGNSKLFAVGDDWQAIYRFAGCDVNIFLQFAKIFEDAKINKITSTHRNSAELQAIVEPFITANPEQYKKHIHSEKHQKNPVRIIYHNNDRESAFIKAIENIYAIDKNADILVLGRNRHDIDCLISNEYQLKNYSEIISSKYPTLKITYKTVHQSKGLESDYVILISGEDAKNGFPNQMEDDRLLQLVLGNESPFLFAEERRLFYVALTRTRSIVYILSDRINTSIFVEEIETRSNIENPELVKRDDLKRFLCPWCKSGNLVIRESAETGNSFYGCANYPFCEYTINDLKAVATNNRCPECGDFLVIRNGSNGRFIGCHNYPRCRHTRQLK